jgi:hypothetical protein
VEKDYVEVKIDTDRMPGGDEVLANYRQGKDGGIPWMVILDAAGNALVTSDGERGNVGYPVEAGEIAHFLTMLRKTAKRISEEEIAGVGRALERTAEEIKGSARGAVLTGAAEKDA